MTGSAQPPTHDRTPPALVARRPPAPAPRGTTVTRLGPAGGSAESRERVPVATVQGTLALDLDLDPAPEPGLLSATPPAPDLRIVPAGTPVEHQELRLWTTRFAQATVEVLAGDRPLPQLLRWTSARVYQDLERRARILAQKAPTPPRGRRVRPQVRSVHVFRPGPRSAEVSVHVRHGHRSRAMAARLEERDGSWRCVALQLG
jgi:hypothetical protein